MSALIEIAARIGYIARGLVYLCLGAVAMLAALDLTPRAEGAAESVAAWAKWPLGQVLILVVASGLIGFAGWRAMQALFDADQHGRSPIGLAIRAGQAASGAVHLGLAFSLFEAADGLGDAAEERHAAQAFADSLLAIPYGDVMVTLAGIIVLVLGLANLAQAIFQDFGKRLRCDPKSCRRAVRLARFGYLGRTIAFAPLGYFLMRAGFEARSAEALSLGQSLQVLEAQPFGSSILAIAALGLIAFGVFAMIEARFRRMTPPKPLASH